MKRRVVWALVASVACMTSCAGSDPVEERARTARSDQGEIMVGATGPWSVLDGSLWSGIELAARQVNQAGGVLGRSLHIVKSDDEGSVAKGQVIAQELADDPHVIAVLSHSDPAVAETTSVMYDVHGVLNLDLSSSPHLTQRGLKRVFGCLPKDAAVGRTLARFASTQGYERIVIFQLRDDGRNVANAFERAGRSLGLRVVDRRTHDSFDPTTVLARDLKHWRDSYSPDAILIAGSLWRAAQVMKEARKLGVQAPFLGGGTMDSEAFLAAAGGAAEGAHVGSVFDPDSSTQEVRAFVEDYKNQYGTTPGTMAAIGYDSVKLLAAAIGAAETTVPDEIAAALRSLQGWEGVTGSYNFDEHGERISGVIFVKVVKDGRLNRVR